MATYNAKKYKKSEQTFVTKSSIFALFEPLDDAEKLSIWSEFRIN